MDTIDQFKAGYNDQEAWTQHVLATKGREYQQLMQFRAKIPKNAPCSYRFGMRLFRWTHSAEVTIAMCSIMQAALHILEDTGVETYAEVPDNIKTDLLDALKRAGII